nr:uncharacterized protein LOC129445993 [Misgurnus anguillicaudatus]
MQCSFNSVLSFLVIVDMAFANFKLTTSQQLVMRASGEAVAFVAAKGPRGTAPAAAKAKKPEEVEKEAQALVVSKGGDPGNGMLVLGCYSIQFGMYRGQTFRWLLENDVGYTTQLVASHQREREKSASDSPLMANKDALVRYACAHPAFVEQLRFHRLYEEARARASQPGCEGEALVGFGDYKEVTLKDLYSSEKKKHQNFVKYLRRMTPQPGTTMYTAKTYILARDKERSAEAAASPHLPQPAAPAVTPARLLPMRCRHKSRSLPCCRAYLENVQWTQVSCRPRSGS